MIGQETKSYEERLEELSMFRLHKRTEALYYSRLSNSPSYVQSR